MNSSHQNARFTVRSRDQIVARIGAGQSAAEVAAAFGVSVPTVRKRIARIAATEDKVEARMTNGVLRILVGRPEDDTPGKIESRAAREEDRPMASEVTQTGDRIPA